MLYAKVHHQLNNLLEIMAIGICLYLILIPFAPNLIYWWQITFNRIPKLPMNLTQLQNVSPIVLPTSPPIDSFAQQLIIPKIFVDTPILTGTSPNLINQGIWLRPQTASPDLGGNTVLVGHRFQYVSGLNTFYLLDKLIIDDLIYLKWHGKEYTYKVSEVRVVNPTQVDIESKTNEPILTLYTCTPLWTANQRLVVKAKLIQ